MVSTWEENKLQRAEDDRMASLISDQKPKCERRQDRQSGLRPQGRVRPRCLEWGYKSRPLIAGSDLMVSKNTDRRERPLTKGATPQGKTERMATHVDAFVELATDSGSIPDTSTKTMAGRGRPPIDKAGTIPSRVQLTLASLSLSLKGETHAS